MSSEDLRSQLDGLFSDIVLDLEAEKEEAVVGPTEAEIAERQRREVPPTSVLVREAKLRQERARVIEIGLYILLIILVIIVAVTLGVVLLRLARRAMSLDIHFRGDIFNVLTALGMANEKALDLAEWHGIQMCQSCLPYAILSLTG
jgi:hypothetical protein